MKLAQARRHALSLEATAEAPHHDYASFRVRGKIFATVPPDGEHLHVFVPPDERDRALALYPGCMTRLSWGQKVLGLRIHLPQAPAPAVNALLDAAYAARVAKDAPPPRHRPTPAAADAHAPYLATLPPDRRAPIMQVQAVVEAAVPGAERCIAYRMPAYRRGKVFFYVAAFKKHLGIYPPVSDDAALVAELQPWRGPKGNLSFAFDSPLPLALIGRVAAALAAQYAAD
jgi:uncharacterized protein YdhG (YjbR/CyaY superfamily)